MAIRFSPALVFLALFLPLLAQENPPATQPPAPPAPVTKSTEPSIQTGTLILGVLPNYKTVEKMTAYQPITPKQKFMIATKDTFCWQEYLVSASVTELDTISGQDPEWGQGVKGYAKRFGAAVADQTSGNYLTEGILPTVLHEDPRYFRLGRGSVFHRTAHALSWVVIAKTDHYHNTFNWSEQIGSFASASIGLAYYPAGERNLDAVLDRYITEVSYDAASSVLKEFWPDIRQKFFHKSK
jgi:hypothetical protein